MKNKKVAWYLDEDVLLEGTVIESRFHADRNICGFDVQEFDEDMIGKEIFFDLQKAFLVCGEIPIVNCNGSNRT